MAYDILIPKVYLAPQAPNDVLEDIQLNVSTISCIESVLNGTTRVKYNYGANEILIDLSMPNTIKFLDALIEGVSYNDDSAYDGRVAMFKKKKKSGAKIKEI